MFQKTYSKPLRKPKIPHVNMNHVFPESGSLCLTPDKGSPLYTWKDQSIRILLYTWTSFLCSLVLASIMRCYSTAVWLQLMLLRLIQRELRNETKYYNSGLVRKHDVVDQLATSQLNAEIKVSWLPYLTEQNEPTYSRRTTNFERLNKRNKTYTYFLQNLKYCIQICFA